MDFPNVYEKHDSCCCVKAKNVVTNEVVEQVKEGIIPKKKQKINPYSHYTCECYKPTCENCFVKNLEAMNINPEKITSEDSASITLEELETRKDFGC